MSLCMLLPLHFLACHDNNPPARRSSRISKPSQTQDQLTLPTFFRYQGRQKAGYPRLSSFIVQLSHQSVLSAISPVVVIQTTNLAHNNLVSLLLLDASWRCSASLDKSRSFLLLMRSMNAPIRLGCHHFVTRSWPFRGTCQAEPSEFASLHYKSP